MKILYFDLSAGASGDMILGSLIDAGFPKGRLKNVISRLRLKGCRISVKRIERDHLPGISVQFTGGPRLAPHEMKRRIERSGLEKEIRTRAVNILHCLIDAESHVHRKDPHKVHFHQLSDPDTIVDIVGASAAISYFGVDGIYASNLNAGLLAPATARVLAKAGAPINTGTDGFERLTPTGAAIVVGSDAVFTRAPIMNILAAGFGIGERIIPGGGNLLRCIIGEVPEEQVCRDDRMFCIETNIDDMDPRVYPYVMERLLQDGARDVWFTPIQMKKGRPAIQVSVLCEQKHFMRLQEIIIAETSTLGIRYFPVERSCIPRWKKGNMKYGRFKKNVKKNIELDDAVRIARKSKRPLYEILKGMA